MRNVILSESELHQLITEVVKSVLDETSACLGATYGSVRALAHGVKDGDVDAIDQASLIMMKYVPSNSVLIPIPSHYGNATYTLKLANFIAKRAKSKVLDILSSNPREMLYKQKIRGVDISKINLGFKVVDDENINKMLHSARNIILIDNVIDSGATYEQAKDIIKQTYGVDVWLLTLGAVEYPKNKSYDVIRSIYPNRRGLYEEIKKGGGQ